MVNLKIARCAAILAAPPIARQHLAGELGDTRRVQGEDEAVSRLNWIKTIPHDLEQLQPLRYGKNGDQPSERQEQHIFRAWFEACSRQKIGGDHFQAIARDLPVPSISAAISSACSMTASWLLYTLK